jgi:DNA-binding FadR family transcriptional regulator
MIARSAGNTLLLVLFDTVFASRTPTSWGRLHENPRAQLRRTAATNEHVAIVQSIRDRDPDMAAKHMSDHLSAVRNVLLGPHRANPPTDSSNEADLAIGAT